MTTVKSLLTSPVDDAYAAFSLGYSDYMLPVKITKEAFLAHFFGPEGNDPSLSFLAYEGDRPVGLCLGGVRVFDGVSTMRCGTLCVAPEFRARGVGRALFERHRAAAREMGCARLFLEVLTHNERALRFYEAAGYTRAHVLKYYAKPGPFAAPGVNAPEMRALGYSDWLACRNALADVHINWQNEPVCYEKAVPEALRVLGAYGGGQRLGLAAMTAQGKTCFLYVEPEARSRGIGQALLLAAAQRTGAEKLSVSFPDHTVPEGFLLKAGFTKEPIEQYEMALSL